MLQDKKEEPGLYEIPKELDPTGYKWIKAVERAQARVPQTLLVKVRTVRCLKDKVASGHYLVLVHATSRLGGDRLVFNETNTEHHYKTISQNLRQY